MSRKIQLNQPPSVNILFKPTIVEPTQPSTSVTIKLVTDERAFEALEQQWGLLWSNTSTASPFNSFDWHDTWWSVFTSDKNRLQIWTVWDDNTLVGLLPMYTRGRGNGRSRTLRFLGTGESRTDEVATEYSDILVSPDYEDVVLPLAVQWLTSSSAWSRVDMRCMLDSALLLKALDTYKPDANRLNLHAGFRFRVPLDNQQTPLELMAGSNAKRVKRSLKAIDRDGGLLRASASQHGAIGNALNRLIRLNRERQGDKHRKSAFESQKFLRFHQRLCERMVPKGLADIHCYYLGETLLATMYCFYDKHTAYYYQSGFSTCSSNKYMPLTAAHLEQANSARDSHRRFYDLMRAELPSYKEAMASDKEPLFNVYLFGEMSAMKRYRLMRRMRRALVRNLRKVGIERH